MVLSMWPPFGKWGLELYCDGARNYVNAGAVLRSFVRRSPGAFVYVVKDLEIEFVQGAWVLSFVFVEPGGQVFISAASSLGVDAQLRMRAICERSLTVPRYSASVCPLHGRYATYMASSLQA